MTTFPLCIIDCPIVTISYPHRASLILDDLDDIFSDELAQIDGLMDARKTKNEERKKRIEKETEDLKDVELRAPQVGGFAKYLAVILPANSCGRIIIPSHMRIMYS